MVVMMVNVVVLVLVIGCHCRPGLGGGGMISAADVVDEFLFIVIGMIE